MTNIDPRSVGYQNGYNHRPGNIIRPSEFEDTDDNRQYWEGFDAGEADRDRQAEIEGLDVDTFVLQHWGIVKPSRRGTSR